MERKLETDLPLLEIQSQSPLPPPLLHRAGRGRTHSEVNQTAGGNELLPKRQSVQRSPANVNDPPSPAVQTKYGNSGDSETTRSKINEQVAQASNYQVNRGTHPRDMLEAET